MWWLDKKELPPADALEEGYEPDSAEMPDSKTYSMHMKRKRRTAMLKKILEDAGYDDMAKSINIRED